MAAVIVMTFAPPGSGKSWSRVRELVDDYLPHSKGKFIHNLPLYEEKIADYCERVHGLDREETLERLVKIPQKVLDSWADKENPSHPKKYFVDTEVAGARIEIDEASSFTGDSMERKRSKFWEELFKELRHRKCTCNLIAQFEEQVPAKLRKLAEVKYELTNTQSRRDFLFNIQMDDWYQLKTKFVTGEWKPAVYEYEYRKKNTKWIVEDVRVFYLGEPYYSLYNSYNAPVGEEDSHEEIMSKNEAETKLPYERYNRKQLLWWFFKRNWGRLLTRLIAIIFAGWVLLFGGFGYFIGFLQSMFVSSVKDGQTIEKIEDGRENENISYDASNITSEEVVLLIKEADKVKQSIEELEEENKKLKEEIEKLDELTAITDKKIYLRSGHRYVINDVIISGKYRGYKIADINVQKRQVILIKNKDIKRLWLLGR